jgi:hypothetical protein
MSAGSVTGAWARRAHASPTRRHLRLLAAGTLLSLGLPTDGIVIPCTGLLFSGMPQSFRATSNT